MKLINKLAELKQCFLWKLFFDRTK